MTGPRHRDKWYWEKYIDDEGRWRTPGKEPPGEDLATMRRGLGRLPGSLPAMGKFYEAVMSTADSRELRAEHAALCLYGLHQQSQRIPLHRPGIGLGDALRALKKRADVSDSAVDRRFNAAATSTSVEELVAHLRGLVTQLRSKQITLDYSQLLNDLWSWEYPDGQSRVRRQWGMQYHSWQSTGPDEQPQP